jgi:alkanesulfonate monooxygenase
VRSFVDVVVPELQDRGLYKRAYAPGTLREKLFGAAQAKLPQSHPAARARLPEAASRAPMAAVAP